MFVALLFCKDKKFAPPDKIFKTIGTKNGVTHIIIMPHRNQYVSTDYIDSTFRTLISSLSIGLSMRIALLNGTYTIWSFLTPIMMFL